MSPIKARLLPVAVTQALAGSSGASDRPRIRARTTRWVSMAQRNSPPSGASQLSMAITWSPASSRAPRRFSSSSSVLPWAMTPASRPLAMTLARSTSIDLPEPAVGAVKPCIGAVGSERRIQAVRMAERVTARLGPSTKGKVATRSSSSRNAAAASTWVGRSGTAGKHASPVSSSRPVARS